MNAGSSDADFRSATVVPPSVLRFDESKVWSERKNFDGKFLNETAIHLKDSFGSTPG